ncbi:MAG: hypothetical protein ACXVB9_04210 [Bdellovibrionota bacterium]
MRAKTAVLLLLIAISAGLIPGRFAMGSIENPGSALPAPALDQHPAALVAKPRKKANRRISSYFSELQAAVLAKFRPVEHNQPIDFNEATALLNSKTINEQIFNKDFSGKMQGEYAGRVKPFEETANDPLWRPRYWETQRYEDSREGLARWTTREVMEDQLKDFFNHGDKDSGAMKALATARALSGGEEEKPAEPKLTPEQKIARAHRTDLPVAPQEEEVTPTKLKTKLNVLRQNGSVVFTNPIATTELSGNRDDISMNMHRDFKKISLHSNLAFGMKEECLNFNVNKKITDRVSLDLNHYNYTGSTRGSSGEKTREQAKVNYSLSF